MKNYIFSVLFLLVFVGASRADEQLMLSGLSDMEKMAMISTLEDDILILESEIKKCEKSKKGWIAATVIGSAGVVATGVAAGVQGAQISKQKSDIDRAKTDKLNKENELERLTGKKVVK